MSKKKIVVFSGAGLDAESGIETFRAIKNGLWNNYKIEDVATPSGWRKDREKVLDFYNERRRQMPDVQPNGAHLMLAKLEEHFDVQHVTQNVSDLLERGGCTNIIHLHGELTKARGCQYVMSCPDEYLVDVGYNDIKLGDKCQVSDSQLRPNVVWFGEMPFGTDRAYQSFRNADIIIIVGTSLQISYTLEFFNYLKDDCKIIYIDPEPVKYLSNMGLSVTYSTKGAVEGITETVNSLLNEQH